MQHACPGLASPLIAPTRYFIDDKTRLLHIIIDKWPKLSDLQSSALLVHPASPSIQRYSPEEQDELVRMSEKLYGLATVGVWRAAPEVVARVASVGSARRMLYDVTKVVAFGQLLLQRLDEVTLAEAGFEGYEEHRYGLRRGIKWVAQIPRELLPDMAKVSQYVPERTCS